MRQAIHFMFIAGISALVASCGGDSTNDGGGGDAERFVRSVFTSLQEGDSDRFASYILPDRRSKPDLFEPSFGDLEGCDVENADIVVVRKADTGSYDLTATFPTVCGTESTTESCYFFAVQADDGDYYLKTAVACP